MLSIVGMIIAYSLTGFRDYLNADTLLDHCNCTEVRRNIESLANNMGIIPGTRDLACCGGVKKATNCTMSVVTKTCLMDQIVNCTCPVWSYGGLVWPTVGEAWCYKDLACRGILILFVKVAFLFYVILNFQIGTAKLVICFSPLIHVNTDGSFDLVLGWLPFICFLLCFYLKDVLEYLFPKKKIVDQPRASGRFIKAK